MRSRRCGHHTVRRPFARARPFASPLARGAYVRRVSPAPHSTARAMESVWCHDCRARVDVDASAFDDDARDCACPSCAGVFLERLPEEPRTTHRGVLSVFFGPALSLFPIGPLGDIDFTLLDTRNFDAPASASAVEALPERAAGEAGLPSGATCSVCLCEYEEEERVMTIPKCSHTFHVNCLMDWLRLVRGWTMRERDARRLTPKIARHVPGVQVQGRGPSIRGDELAECAKCIIARSCLGRRRLTESEGPMKVGKL